MSAISEACFTVVPSDGGDPGVAMGPLGLTYSQGSVQPFDRLYVGVAGDISLKSKNGNTVLLKAVPVGVCWVGGRRVLATNTTATNMVAVRDNL